MLTAGDEFGRTQRGNNNAYCQDNEITWLDWAGRDRDLEAFAFGLAEMRAGFSGFAQTHFLGSSDVEWLDERGVALDTAAWEDPARRRLCMVLTADGERLAMLFNGDRRKVVFTLPEREEYRWQVVFGDNSGIVGGKSVSIRREVADDRL